MTPIDSANDQNICVELFTATLTIKLRIKEKTSNYFIFTHILKTFPKHLGNECINL